MFHLALWGSIAAYFIFVIVWSFLSVLGSPGFYFAGIIMLSRSVAVQ